MPVAKSEAWLIAAASGYRPLAERGDVEFAFCWSHVRRRFYELAAAGPAPIASEALERPHAEVVKGRAVCFRNEGLRRTNFTRFVDSLKTATSLAFENGDGMVVVRSYPVTPRERHATETLAAKRSREAGRRFPDVCREGHEIV